MSIVIRRPWTRQPQGAVGVDWGNPLTRGLVFSLNPPSGDAVAGGIPSLVGTAARLPRQRGLAFVADDTANDAVAVAGGAGLYSITTQFTVSVWIEPLTAANYCNYFSVPYREAGWTNPYNSLTLYRNTTASNRTTIQWASSSVTTNQAHFTSEQISIGAGTYANYVVTRNDDGTCILYKNGVLVLSASITLGTNAAVDWNEKRPVTLLNASSSFPNSGYTGHADGADIWNRALTAAEVSAYYANRFQLYAPRKIYIPTGTGAAATVPTLSASTYVPGSLTSTGWRPQITAS